MKRLALIFFLLLLLLQDILPQTQVLKVGNAVQYWYTHSPGELRLTIDTELINGKEYFKRKISDYTVNPNFHRFSYERIDGDSIYYILSSKNTDSLVFNFNWIPGMLIKSDTVVFDSLFNLRFLYCEKLDSVKIETTFLPNDTVYYISIFGINLTNGDTLTVFPSTNRIYKKLGRKYNMEPLGFMDGVKIDGIRYGTVFPFPEEIVFSTDSLFVTSVIDTGSVFIVNNSDFPLRVDSIISVGSFFGYRGWFSLPQTNFWFYLIQSYPSYWTDTLRIIIAPHDSIKVSFFDVDLCPICDYSIKDYFIDTLRFVFTYLYNQEYNFNFSKFIQISGEGHTSIINEGDIKDKRFYLYQNYPNPFNPTTTIHFELGSKQFVALRVFNSLGQHVKTLIEEEKQIGKYEIDFDAASIPSGVYFYQLVADGKIQTKKMLIIR